MRVFVASWFFPPNSSSEGFVTYKLLRNSRHQYDVVCSTSHQWGYADSLEISDPNIRIIPVNTEKVEVWQRETVEIFERENKAHPYSVIMTRSMPPESLLVGLEIQRRHPEVKWIASMGDPVGNNPYCVSSMALFVPPDERVNEFIADLNKISLDWAEDWEGSSNETISYEARQKKLQEKAMSKADVVICPSESQRQYMSKGCPSRRFEIIPHAYDEGLYARGADYDPQLPKDRVNLVYLGYSDQIRSLMPIVKALKAIHTDNPALANRLSFHVFGNNPSDLSDYAESFQLPRSLICVHGNCSYWQSLKIMQSADWLVHVDGYFSALSEVGGSIFFAGKLADYMGASRPVLALTGRNSPADVIVSNYGGVSFEPWDVTGLMRALQAIARQQKTVSIDACFRNRYDGKCVAERFDGILESLNTHVVAEPAKTLEVIGAEPSSDKLLTVCVPCYNGSSTLARCIESLLRVENPSELDVIVVDDGSRDASALIARRYVEQNPGVVRLVRKPNGGHGSGVNVGIDNAAGLYFRVLDADDWVSAEALSKALAYMRAHRGDPADVCYSEYRLVDSVTGIGSPWPQLAEVDYGKVYAFDELDVSKVYFTMAGSAFRTAVLRESGLRCGEHRFYTDSEYILKPIPFVKTAVFLKDPVYRYWRGQEGQSVSFSSFVRNFEDHNAVIKGLIEYYKTMKMPAPQAKYFYRMLKEHLVTHYRIMEEFDGDKARGQMRKRDFSAYLRREMPDLYVWLLAHRSARPFVGKLVKRGLSASPRKRVKRLIKGLLPYGVIRLWQKHKYGM